MSKYIERIVKNSYGPWNGFQGRVSQSLSSLVKPSKCFESLWKLLRKQNGFYAFESALFVFGIGVDSNQELEAWNRQANWKDRYPQVPFCFAENAFGEQFGILDDVIIQFDPETGSLERCANSLEGWARELCNEDDYWLGYSLMHDWQAKNGAIQSGYRLLPRIPFVLGGELQIENLVCKPAKEGMEIRSQLFEAIRDLPDGTAIEFEIS